MTDSSPTDGAERPEQSVSRRRFVVAAGSGGAIAGLAGCSGGSPGSRSDSGGESDSTTSGGTAGSPSADEITVKYAGTSADKQNADELQQALYDAGLPEHITVDFLAISDISDNIQSQYRQWLTAGRSTPDILRMDNGWTMPFVVREQLLNLSERLSSEALDRLNNDYFQSIVDTSRGPDGDLYGVPYNIGFPTIQYRKDLAEQAGYDPEGNGWATEPMSWRRFSEVVADIRDQTGTKHGYAWQGKNYEGLSCCTFNELLTSYGGAYFGGRDTLFGPVGDRPITVTEDPAVDAVRAGRALIYGSENDDEALDGITAVSPKSVLQWTEGPSLSAFTEGDAVAVRYWPSGVYKAGKKFGEKLGVMPIPYGVKPDQSKYDGAGGTAAALGGWNVTVNPHSERVDAAVAVIETMLKPEFRTFQFTNLEYIVPDRGVLSSDEAKDVEIWGPHLDSLRVAGEHTVPRPATVVWPDESGAIAKRVNAALARQTAPADAMSALKADLREIEDSA